MPTLTQSKVAAFFSAILTGSPVLLLDLEVPITFGQIEEVDIEVVIIHLNRLVADLDLTIYPKLKHVYFLGSSNFKVKTNIPSTHIESKSPYHVLSLMFYILVFENKERIKPTNEQQMKVRDFEVEANKSAWVGFNPSSGTTFQIQWVLQIRELQIREFSLI